MPKLNNISSLFAITTSYPIRIWCVVILGSALIGAVADAASPSANVPGLAGGAINAIASNPSDTASIAVAVAHTGLYVGSPTGSWTPQALETGAASTALSYDNTGRLFVATSGYGLWSRSVAGTWAKVNIDGVASVHSVDRDVNGNMWVATNRGVYTLGSNLTAIKAAEPIKGSAMPVIRILALPKLATGSVYGTDGASAYRLQAGTSATWASISSPAPILTIQQEQGGALLAGTPKGIYRYSNGVWATIGLSGIAVNAIVADADGAVYAGTNGQGVKVYKAGTWSDFSAPAPSNRKVLALIRDGNNSLIAGYPAGLAVLTAGTAAASRVASTATFNSQNSVLGGSSVRALVADASRAWAVVPGMGVQQWSPASGGFVDASAGLTDDVQQLSTNGKSTVAITESGKLMRYVESGVAGWVEVASSALTAPLSTLFLDNDDTVWFGGTSGGVVLRWKKTGTQWERVNVGLERVPVTNFASLPNGTLFGATRGAGVVRWDEATKKWLSIGADGLPIVATPSGQERLLITALTIQGNTIYVGTPHGVFSKSATGNTSEAWISVSSGLGDPAVTTLVADNSRVIAGTMKGAYVLTSNAAKWTAYGDASADHIESLTILGGDVLMSLRARPGVGARTVRGS